MRTSFKILIVSAAVALAGSAALALPTIHRMTVALPGGGIETVSYRGDMAPKIQILPYARPTLSVLPQAPFGPRFAGLDQISDEMNQMAIAMDWDMASAMREMNAMMPLATPNGLTNAALGKLPAGSEVYSISTMSGGNICTRDLQVTSSGNGQKPKVISHTSGDCAGAPSASAGFANSPSAGTGVIKIKGRPLADNPAPHI